MATTQIELLPLSDVWDQICSITRLCDEGLPALDDDDGLPAAALKGCACDNCFYGRDKLARDNLLLRGLLGYPVACPPEPEPSSPFPERWVEARWVEPPPSGDNRARKSLARRSV